MDPNIQKIIENLRSVHLTAEEKSLLRQKLLTLIHNDIPQPSPYISRAFVWQSFFKSKTFAYVVVFIFIIGASSTVAFAAEQSLPGDLLYPIKIHVNENIARAFHQSAGAQVSFETALMEKRLVEAENLDKRNELTGNRKNEINTGLMAQEDRVAQAIVKLGEEKKNKKESVTEIMTGVKVDVSGSTFSPRTSVDTTLDTKSSDKNKNSEKSTTTKDEMLLKTQINNIVDESDQTNEVQHVEEVHTILQKHQTIIEKIQSNNSDTKQDIPEIGL